MLSLANSHTLETKMLKLADIQKRLLHFGLVALALCVLPVAVALAGPAEDGFAQMRALHDAEKPQELVDQFKDVDLSTWPEAARAFHLRGHAYLQLKDAANAERDLEAAVERSPKNGYFWHSLAETYRRFLKDDARALNAYNKAFEMVRADNGGQKPYGWMPINATLEAATILLHQTKYAEALKVMERYDDSDAERLGVYWGRRMLRMYGHIYAAMGREEECLAKFHAALELEKK